MVPKGKRPRLDKIGEVSIKKVGRADIPASEWENTTNTTNTNIQHEEMLLTDVDDHREKRLEEFLEKEGKVVMETHGTKYVSGFLKSGVPPAPCTLHTNLAFAPILPTSQPQIVDNSITKPPLLRKVGQFPLDSDSTFQQTMDNMAEETKGSVSRSH